MPYYAKSEDWLQQSALLLQARPATVIHPKNPIPNSPSSPTNAPLNTQTRITTQYKLAPAHRTTKAEKLAAKAAAEGTAPPPPQPAQPTSSGPKAADKPPRGHLVLKTFDPNSGVTLKYKTSKAAEVTRLVQMLGQLGRRMAALPVSDNAKEDVAMGDAPEAGAEGSGVQTPVTPAVPVPAAGAGGGGGGGGGKGKKKKGKR